MGIDVSDSLSDTFEYMAFAVNLPRCFVLRAKENRKLETPVNGHRYLLDAVRSLPASGTCQRQVLPSSTRQGRTATLQVAFTALSLAVPRKHVGEYAKKPLPLWAVRLWEANPPAGEEPLEWILLTNVLVAQQSDAEARADWYACRPIVEELHKGMKTGCGIETLQFEKIERLEPAIAVLSVVTTTLLRLRDAAGPPDAETR